MKLLVCDVEGTIFKTNIRLPGTDLSSTIWQSIAYYLGEGAIQEEIATHSKWKSGCYSSYLQWMVDTIEIHKKYGLDKIMFEKIINGAEYNIGVKEFFLSLDREKYIPVLISGGFSNLAKRAQIDLKISHSFAACEYFFVNDKLSAYNLLPCDFWGKVQFINILIKEYNLSDSDWIFIGDGNNDVDIANAANVSIGINADKELENTVDYCATDFFDIINILKKGVI